MIKNCFNLNLTIAIFLLIMSRSAYAEDDEIKTYVPYPIVFIHGVHSSSATWSYAKENLEQYFKDENGSKYDYNTYTRFGSKPWFLFCDYSSMPDGNVNVIARYHLKDKIMDQMEGVFPADYPSSKKKVTIVAHSMGGLVTRDFLLQYPDSDEKIDKIVYLGTPHYGSPFGSALWIFNEMLKEGSELRNLEKEFPATDIKEAGLAPNLFNPAGGSSLSFLRGSVDFGNAVRYRIHHIQRIIDLIKNTDCGPSASSKAVEQLRLSSGFNVTFSDEIQGVFEAVYTRRSYAGFHYADETFTYSLNMNGNSYIDNSRIVRGEIPLLFEYTLWGVNRLFEFDDNFAFPKGQSIRDAYNTGDGIVTKDSQDLFQTADYTVDAAHIGQSLGFTRLYGECDRWETILEAIDDPPEITKIQLIPKNWLPLNEEEALPYYIIVSSKEYLLADLEVLELTVDGKAADGFQSTVKPYELHGKDFLKKRTSDIIKDADGKGIVLNPGDFYAEVDITKGVHIIKLSVRNPAQAIKGGKNDKVTVTVKVARPEVKDVTFVNEESELSLCSSWCVDVPVYDETQIEYDYKNRVGNKGYAQFTVESPLYKDVKVDIDIYDLVYTSSSYGPSAIQKKLVDDQTVTLDDLETTDTEGNIKYTGCFPDTDTLKKDDELQWTGTNDSGSYVEEKKTYPLRISVHSPTQDGLYPPFDITDESGMEGLTGSNWDDENGFRNDIIYAEPTFVQENRQIDLPGGLNISIELLGNINTEKDNNNLLSKNINKQIIAGHIRNNLIPILDSLVTEEIAYDSAKRIIIKYYNQTNISPKIAHNLIKFVSILRNCKIIEIRQRINFFIKDINIPNAIINKKRLWLYYKHSINSMPVKFMICDASDNNTTGVNKQKNV